jgi:hypothetical protein
MDVYWEGLALSVVQPLTDAERRHAEGRLSPWLFRLGAWPGLVIAATLAAVWLLHPHLRFEIVVPVVAIGICGLMLAIGGAAARPSYREKAVFSGHLEAIPGFSPLRRTMRRLGVREDQIEAEVLKDGALFALNGRPLARRLMVAHPVTLAKLGHAGDPGQLSDAERLELRMSFAILCKYPDGFAWGAFLMLIQSVVDFRKPDSWSEKLAYTGIALALTVVTAAWSRVCHARLDRDVAEGLLESVGNRRVLKHSRKAWTVGGRPAGWRRAYLGGRRS